jgi:Flp pilus assembly protein TadB
VIVWLTAWAIARSRYKRAITRARQEERDRLLSEQAEQERDRLLEEQAERQRLRAPEPVATPEQAERASSIPVEPVMRHGRELGGWTLSRTTRMVLAAVAVTAAFVIGPWAYWVCLLVIAPVWIASRTASRPR